MKPESSKKALECNVVDTELNHDLAQRMGSAIAGGRRHPTNWYTKIIRSILAKELKKTRETISYPITISKNEEESIELLKFFDSTCCNINYFHDSYNNLPSQEKIIIKDYLVGNNIEEMCHIHAISRSRLISHIKIVLSSFCSN